MVTYSAMASVAGNTASLSSISNSTNENSNAITSKAEFGASVVSKTLDNLNKSKSGKSNGITPSYEMQKSILDAGLSAKGIVISSVG